MAQFYFGSSAWNVGDILDEAEATLDITVTGAALGDYCDVAASLNVLDLELSAQVISANNVTVTLSNVTGGTLDMLTPDIYVKVTSRSALHQTDA